MDNVQKYTVWYVSESSLDDISSCQNGKNINTEKSLEPSGALFAQLQTHFHLS